MWNRRGGSGSSNDRCRYWDDTGENILTTVEVITIQRVLVK